MADHAICNLPASVTRLIRIPHWLRRVLGLCRLELHVELSKCGASSLDAAAILGIGHDRGRLLHRYFAQCVCVHRTNCSLLPWPKFQGEARVTIPIVQHIRQRLKFATAGQGHLFDRNGYAPGIYQIDPEFEAAVLCHLHCGNDTPANGAATVLNDGVENAESRTEQCERKRHVRQPSSGSHTHPL